CARGVIFDIW
nr:immunoglobulin heavy chain junction region [Macaca mulatta]